MNISKLSRRFWAFIFDDIIVLGIYSGILLLLKYALNMDIPVYKVLDRDPTAMAVYYLSFGLLYLIYEVLFVSLKVSATPGKMLLGLEIVAENRSSFFRVLLRSLAKVIAIVTSVLPFILFILAAFSEKKQTIHDKIAGTYVIRKNVRRYAPREVDVEELFEEMKRRGYRTYSEQKALAEELYGAGNNNAGTSYAWLGALFLIFALACNAFFTIDLIPIFQDYLLKQVTTQIRYKENGVQVDREIAEKYLGIWITDDRKFGFTVFYDDENGTMYINTSQRALKFRFDSSNTLFVTDGNDTEFEVSTSIYGNALIMTRPINENLQYKITLKEVNSL
ncbi:MAG TPA: RDD family protein [Acetivibrio sp.]|nr:RDD family protein [Clostridium sp.]HOQ36603.1 RDD family protein [Acetivibrio sp.]